jgi:glycosyltransferase involved in cell wall biosynthesis
MKVCYYAIGHPLLSENVGGAEIQLHLIGKELQKKGIEPHYIIEDEGKEIPKEISGQYLHKVKSFRSPLAALFLAPQLLSNAFFSYNRPDFDAALFEAQPDILHQRGSSVATGYFASFAEKNKKPFVFTIASLGDCTLSGGTWSGFFRSTIKKRLYLYGLSRADVIVATADYLKDEMQKLMPKKDIRIIRSGHPVPEGKLPEKKDKAVLVGRAMDYHYPTEFLNLARKFPKCEFSIIGGAKKSEDYQRLLQEAKQIKNLKIYGFLPLEEVNKHIAESKLLIDTSFSAGFHNTFIQAWLRRTVVVSLKVDPDNLLKGGLGMLSGSEQKLSEDLGYLLENEDERKKIAEKAFKYAKENYDIKTTGEEHAKLYKELANR